MRHAAALSMLAVLWLSAPARALAQDDLPDDPKKRARILFEAGAVSVDSGKPADGLPKLEEAERLFHAPTHVLYIARARARLGKLIEAREAYDRLVREKLPDGASEPFLDAQASGRTELVELERRTPKLMVKVEPSDVPALSIVMNGATFGVDRLGAAFAVDPGVYVFEARAEGFEGPKVTVDAAERTTTEVRLLLRALGGPRPDVEPKPVVVTTAVTPAVEPEGASGLRIASIGLMALGGAGLALGGVMTGLHFSSAGEADDLAACAPDCTSAEIDEIVSLDEQAAAFGTTGIIGLSAGGALLGAAIILFVVGAPDSAASASDRVRVRPLVGAGFVGVDGAF